MALTYQHGSSGDAGDPYTGLDRFGRVIDLRWNKSSTALVSSKYGYDRNSNQTWHKDVAAAAASVNTEDQMFWYDGLQQVYQRQRGTLTPGSPPYTGIQQTEAFSFDETGNWLTDYNSTGGTAGGILSQSRSHNMDNEISNLTNHTALKRKLPGNLLVLDPETDPLPQVDPSIPQGNYNCAGLAFRSYTKMSESEARARVSSCELIAEDSECCKPPKSKCCISKVVTETVHYNRDGMLFVTTLASSSDLHVSCGQGEHPQKFGECPIVSAGHIQVGSVFATSSINNKVVIKQVISNECFCCGVEVFGKNEG